MPTILSDEVTGEDCMSSRQANYIASLLEARRVSARCASRIIQMLEEQPQVNGDGLDNLKLNIQREGT